MNYTAVVLLAAIGEGLAGTVFYSNQVVSFFIRSNSRVCRPPLIRRGRYVEYSRNVALTRVLHVIGDNNGVGIDIEEVFKFMNIDHSTTKFKIVKLCSDKIWGLVPLLPFVSKKLSIFT